MVAGGIGDRCRVLLRTAADPDTPRARAHAREPRQNASPWGPRVFCRPGSSRTIPQALRGLALTRLTASRRTCRSVVNVGGKPFTPHSLRPISRNLAARWSRISAGPMLPNSRRAPATASPVAVIAASRVAVRAAGRLRHDAVDDAEAQQVLRGDLHVGGRVLGAAAVAPQDRGGALGRDHAVDRVLQHQDLVGGRDRDGPARAALADDDGDVRARRGPGSASVERAMASAWPRSSASMPGIGAGRVDEGRAPAARSGRRAPSGGPPCGSPPAGPCRNCGGCASRSRSPSPGRGRRPPDPGSARSRPRSPRPRRRCGRRPAA